MTTLVGYLLLFTVIGIGFIFIHLLAGKLIRPSKPGDEKLTIYECGEPTIGSAWVQFDLRYYVVALLFVIFDVEVAFFFPWAVVFGQANTLARLDEQGQMPITEPAKTAKAELLGLGDGNYDRPTEKQQADLNQVGRDISQLALLDILVFFGVLLVGFAYLWRRGDLAWIKSTAAERTAPTTKAA